MWGAFGCCPEELLESSGSNVASTSLVDVSRSDTGVDRSVDLESDHDQHHDHHHHHLDHELGENTKSFSEDHGSLSHSLQQIIVENSDSNRGGLSMQPDFALEGSSFQNPPAPTPMASAATTLTVTTTSTTNAMENIDAISDCIDASVQLELKDHQLDIKDHGSTSTSSGFLEDLTGIPMPQPPPPPQLPCDQVILPFPDRDLSYHHHQEIDDHVSEFFPPVVAPLVVDHSAIHQQHHFALNFHHPLAHPLQSPFFRQHGHSPLIHPLHRSLSAGNLSLSPQFPLGFLSSPISRISSPSTPTSSAAAAVTSPGAAASASPEDPTAKAGRYSPEERKVRIDRYRQKRSERNYIKKIKYACRKTLADSRPRIRGRFAKNQDAGVSQMKRSLDDDDDDEVESFCDILMMGDEAAEK